MEYYEICKPVICKHILERNFFRPLFINLNYSTHKHTRAQRIKETDSRTHARTRKRAHTHIISVFVHTWTVIPATSLSFSFFSWNFYQISSLLVFTVEIFMTQRFFLDVLRQTQTTENLLCPALFSNSTSPPSSSPPHTAYPTALLFFISPPSSSAADYFFFLAAAPVALYLTLFLK